MIVAYVASDRIEGRICAEGPFLSRLSSTSSSPLGLKRDNGRNETVCHNQVPAQMFLPVFFSVLIPADSLISDLLRSPANAKLHTSLKTSAELLGVYNFERVA